MAIQRVMVTATPQALQDLPGVRAGDVFVIQVDGLSHIFLGQYIDAPDAATAVGLRIDPKSPGVPNEWVIHPNSDPEKEWLWVRPGERATSVKVVNAAQN